MSDQFVVVSIYTPPGRKPIIHAYGPKPTRQAAIALKNELTKNDKKFYPDGTPNLIFVTCKILGGDWD